MRKTIAIAATCILGFVLGLTLPGCTGDKGDQGNPGGTGPNGPTGPQGEDGLDGMDGEDGLNGVDGMDGEDGEDGRDANTCPLGKVGSLNVEGVPVDVPLSAVVAFGFCDVAATDATNIADYVKALVVRYGTSSLEDVEFPLGVDANDHVRSIAGLVPNVLAKWLDPLDWTDDANTPRFGANADFIGYFGKDWELGGTPIYGGSDNAGWLWVNHEYVSNTRPGPTVAATGSYLTLARWMARWSLVSAPESNAWDPTSLSAFTRQHKRQVGGSWMKIKLNPGTHQWQVSRMPGNRRYDATDATRLLVSGGIGVTPDHDDTGAALPTNVVAGITGDCSGTVTPWGTVITAEENVQDQYGDLESNWTADQRFILGQGFDPGANVAFNTSPSPTSEFGSNPDVNTRHPRDVYGFLVEMDPGAAPGEHYGKTTPGVGHQKLGAIGRARWENITFVTGADWKPIPGQPIVGYAGNDRRSGHIYKFVTSQPYTTGMTKAQIRDLLASGTLYVAHFANLDNTLGLRLVGETAPPTAVAPGTGQWIELSTTSTAIAPNAAALGDPTRTVGAALLDVNWNSIGGFPDDYAVWKALFTASLKIGAMELNRPEDLEWNPLDPSGTPRLYVAFTNHNRKVALNQAGVLYPVATHPTDSPLRPDPLGAVFAMQEANPADPSQSTTFTYFAVWSGTAGTGVFDAATPDNVMIDADGGVWFGTDGNFGVNGHSDALYYLDLDPTHATTPVPTYGKAFRVLAAPSDAELTGPAFSSSMSTIFASVQHPGEAIDSSWPPR